MGRYIGTSDVRAFISPNGSLPATQNSLISTCIGWAESAIDDYTRRNFAGTAGTVFYSRWEQTHRANQALYLTQDLYSLSSLTNGDSSPIPVGSVWLEPRNEGPPYRILRLKTAYVWVWNTDSDVQVVGTWGYSTTPPTDIQGAAVMLAAYYYRAKDAPDPNAVSGFPPAGEVTYPKGIPDHIKFILEKYRSRSGGIV